ncbi:ribonuclease HII [Cohaesibacter celericrescens]|uniref:Ribonuclease HII n=1 Tax=Cohaesibacter celericrescens TaxID=2067669 RepID=A0A2N5XKR7_9HYPH|nr:ribonuclease HII [Cohaesibacter celericrescens]PLW75109.1 ribonuclease HII [Cohaesibacter celericrescens]
MKRQKFSQQSSLLACLPQGPDFTLETEATKRFGGPVAGVDEVGRGPLAGPVVTAAVILDAKAIPEGLNDSKKLSRARREALFDAICETSHVSVTSASPEQINRLNIRGATLWAMARALSGLSLQPAYALFDGRDVAPLSPCDGQHVIKGDGRSLSIAAASIVAKVTRDRLMVRIGRAFPGYGFEQHMGYGTKAHMEALDRLGVCIHHRRSFRPIYERMTVDD